MNPFMTDSADDINHLFDSIAQDILINDEPSKAIITNINLTGETEDRSIHTLERIEQGDLITYQDEHYLAIVEVVTKRHSKYKSLIRHCNYDIPVSSRKSVPAIVTDKTFSINETHQIRIGNGQIFVAVADTDDNRNTFEKNEIFEFMHGNWKIIHRDFTQRGLITLLFESTSTPAE